MGFGDGEPFFELDGDTGAGGGDALDFLEA